MEAVKAGAMLGLDWSVAGRPREGEAESGDMHMMGRRKGGVLLAALDGLGHGSQAALASRTAVAALGAHVEESLPILFNVCHSALHDTRGVVMSIVFLDAGQRRLTWLGVGNVQARLLRRDRTSQPAESELLLRPGVVGQELPLLAAADLPLFEGDTLILATDGIRPGFTEGLPLLAAPSEIADRILHTFGTAADDALVLVARYIGEHS